MNRRKKDQTMNIPKHCLKALAGLSVLLLLLGGPLAAQKNPKDQFSFPPLNTIHMPKVEQFKLANGLTVFLVEDHEFPTVDLKAMIRTGSVFEPAAQAGLAGLVGTVLRTGGTATRSGDEIDKELETLAAAIETGIDQTSGTIAASALKEDFSRVLEILADMLTNPAFAQNKIDLARLEVESFIQRRNDDIGGITSREYNKLIYGQGSPYALQPEYATVGSITRDDVVKFYRTYFYPNNTLLAVWGDFNSAALKAVLNKTLGRWKPGSVAVPAWPAVHYEDQFTVNYIDKPDVNQSNIMLGHIGGLMNNPDFPALTVMNYILSFDRMFKKIRTDEGLAYSVWGDYDSRLDFPGMFSCGAQTKSPSTVYAIELMLKEMKRMAAEEVTDPELAKAKDTYLNSFVFRFDSRAKIINRMLTYAYYGYPLDFTEKVKSDVEKVTKADVLRVAKKYLKPDQVQILVVGKAADFDKPLSTLGRVRTIDISIPPPPPAKTK
jgi:zinc protease